MVECMVCTNCHFQGKPKMKGSLLLCILLLILFFPIGILYAVIMSSGTQNVCPKCTKEGMIPDESPKAIEILKQSGESKK